MCRCQLFANINVPIRKSNSRCQCTRDIGFEFESSVAHVDEPERLISLLETTFCFDVNEPDELVVPFEQSTVHPPTPERYRLACASLLEFVQLGAETQRIPIGKRLLIAIHPSGVRKLRLKKPPVGIRFLIRIHQSGAWGLCLQNDAFWLGIPYWNSFT